MKIAIIGAGNVGGGLARRLAAAGHAVTVSAATPGSSRLAELTANTTDAGAPAIAAASSIDAVTGAELVILAVPFGAAADALTPEVAAAAAGKTVVDATNPLAADFMSLTIGHTTSAGEQIAARLPESHVVKAFNTVMAQNLAEPVLGGVPLLLPVAGDDDRAKREVLDLGHQLGFDAIDAGPLSNSRYLEPAVELLIQLAYGQGMGAGIGLTLARA